MIENSKDILNITLAVSVFGLTAFICWGLYYLSMSLKQVFKAAHEIGAIFDKIDKLLDTAKEKLDHSASYLFLIGEGVKKLVDVVGKYTDRKSKKKVVNEEIKENDSK